jgi:hypothetical protein
MKIIDQTNENVEKFYNKDRYPFGDGHGNGLTDWRGGSFGSVNFLDYKYWWENYDEYGQEMIADYSSIVDPVSIYKRLIFASKEADEFIDWDTAWKWATDEERIILTMWMPLR